MPKAPPASVPFSAAIGQAGQRAMAAETAPPRPGRWPARRAPRRDRPRPRTRAPRPSGSARSARPSAARAMSRSAASIAAGQRIGLVRPVERQRPDAPRPVAGSRGQAHRCRIASSRSDTSCPRSRRRRGAHPQKRLGGPFGRDVIRPVELAHRVDARGLDLALHLRRHRPGDRPIARMPLPASRCGSASASPPRPSRRSSRLQASTGLCAAPEDTVMIVPPPAPHHRQRRAHAVEDALEVHVDLPAPRRRDRRPHDARWARSRRRC
jgi:hypothetical protein